jgi:site-specific recombinase XerD
MASAGEDAAPKQPPVLEAFGDWMQEQRGISKDTLEVYDGIIHDLLDRLGENPSRYDARALREFVIERSRQWGRAKAKKSVTVFRMFIRFLISEGKCSISLDAAIPTLAAWRLSSLPRYLQPAEVERVIAACSPNTKVGVRDRAIVLLLARLGLRAGDIVELRLGDINWKEAWIAVSGKGRCEAQLPLSQEVGDAIVAYLKRARPTAQTDKLFIRSRAPYTGFANHCAVSVIVAQAMRRGITCHSRSSLVRFSSARIEAHAP